MAEKVPIRAVYNGSDTCGLSELQDGEVVGVEHGGLGACTFTTDGILLGNTQSAVQVSSALTTNGQLLIGGTSGPAVANITGTANEVEITNADQSITIGLPATVSGLTCVGATCLGGTLQTAAQANVTSVGTLGSLVISGDLTVDTTTLAIDSTNNRVGIGTATPSHLVDIEGVGHAVTCFVSADLCATTKIVGAAICMGGAYALPTSDGTAGYILCTDGSGAVSFANNQTGHTIAEDGSTLTDRTCLNFCGIAVTVTDCSATNSTDVQIQATGACMPIRVTDGTQCYACLSSATIAAPCLQCDSAPKLGGNLDVNGNTIISASNGNIPITPNGSGIVILDGICHPTADGSAGQVLCTDGSAALQFATITATSPGGSDTYVQFNNSSAFGGSANLTWDDTTFKGSNFCTAGTATLATVDINAGAIDGTTIGAASAAAITGTALTASGNVGFDGGTFVFNESGADKDFRIEGDTAANLFITDASTDRIGIGTATPSHLVDIEGVGHASSCFVSADLCATTKVVSAALCVGSQYVLPAADGSAGQLMCTDGSGALAFATAASSGADPTSTNTWTADQTFNDNVKVTLGTGGDADIYYDATNLVITPDVAGSGYISLDGDTRVANGHGVVVGNTAQVTSSGYIPELQVLGTGDADSAMSIGRWSADAEGPALHFIKSRNATIGSSTIVQDDDLVGQLRFMVDDGTNFGSHAATIRVEIDGTPGENDTPGRMTFNTTADGAAGGTERMRIDSSGNVGIGTTSPATGARLHVAHGNSSQTTPEFLVKNTLTGNVNGHTRAQVESGGGDAMLTLYDKSNYWTMAIDQSNSSRLDIGTGQWVSPKLSITTGGNVGIGTVTPCGTLHVKNACSASSSGQPTLVLDSAIDGSTAGSGPMIHFYPGLSGGAALGAVSEGAGDTGLRFFTDTGDNIVERLRITHAGNVGIGTTAPDVQLHQTSTYRQDGGLGFRCTGVRAARSYVGGGVVCENYYCGNCGWCQIVGEMNTCNTSGNSVMNSRLMLSGWTYCYGGLDVQISGANSNLTGLSVWTIPGCTSCVKVCAKCVLCAGTEVVAPTKSFIINHPCCSEDSPNKYNNMILHHASAEGPEYGVFYRGTAQLCDGIAEIELPAYFEPLVGDEERTVQVTAADGWSPLAIKQRPVNGIFIICTTADGNQSQEFDWRVDAIRNDEILGTFDSVTKDRQLIPVRWKEEWTLNEDPEEPDNLDVLTTDEKKEILTTQDMDVDENDTEEDLLVKLRQPLTDRIKDGTAK